MKNLNPFLIIFITFLFTSNSNLFSQKTDLKRFEIEAKIDKDNYLITPVDEKGVIVLYKTNEKSKSKEKGIIWSVSLYDSNFKQKWSSEIIVPDKEILSLSEKDNENIYFVFSEYNSGFADTKSKIDAVKIPIITGKFTLVKGEGANGVLEHISINDGNIFIGGNKEPFKGESLIRVSSAIATYGVAYLAGLTKRRWYPLIYFVDFSKKKMTPHHPNKKEFSFMDAMFTDANSNTHISYHKSGSENNKLWEGNMKEKYGVINTDLFDKNAKIKNNYTIKTKEGNTISAPKAIYTKNGFCYIGKYVIIRPKNEKNDNTDLGAKKLNGIYFTAFDEKNKQKFIKYHDLSEIKEIKNFYDSQPKGSFYSRQGIYLHDPLIKDDEIISIIEVASPIMRIVTTTTTQNGFSSTSSNEVFTNKYETVGLIVIAFGLDGEIKWSDMVSLNTNSKVKAGVKYKYSFDYMNIYDPTLTLNIHDKQTDITISYLEVKNDKKKIETTVISKTIKKNKIVDNSESIRISRDLNIKIKDAESDYKYWFNDYGIEYGYEKIKDKGTKEVFYFYKIGLN